MYGEPDEAAARSPRSIDGTIYDARRWCATAGTRSRNGAGFTVHGGARVEVTHVFAKQAINYNKDERYGSESKRGTQGAL